MKYSRALILPLLCLSMVGCYATSRGRIERLHSRDGTEIYVDRSGKVPVTYVDLSGDGSLDIQFRGCPPQDVTVISGSAEGNGPPCLQRSSALARDLQSQFDYVKEMSKR